jgi:hypothetical protein
MTNQKLVYYYKFMGDQDRPMIGISQNYERIIKKNRTGISQNYEWVLTKL